MLILLQAKFCIELYVARYDLLQPPERFSNVLLSSKILVLVGWDLWADIEKVKIPSRSGFPLANSLVGILLLKKYSPNALAFQSTHSQIRYNKAVFSFSIVCLVLKWYWKYKFLAFWNKKYTMYIFLTFNYHFKPKFVSYKSSKMEKSKNYQLLIAIDTY